MGDADVLDCQALEGARAARLALLREEAVVGPDRLTGVLVRRDLKERDGTKRAAQ